ncbi:MAG TPA: beta-ketoacyl-ACP synthase III [Actinomycetes bacterium]|nr:beta-ketoacyl-ACP synthase III [Actinomycetes bacterium]
MSVEQGLRPSSPSRASRLLGFGAYRPSRVVPNSEIVDRIDSSDEWIRERSGIAERRVAGDGETVLDMATWAAEKALANAGLTADRIGLVVVATVTYLRQTPAAAPIIADRLGANGSAAFDISAACAGFCYGLELAADAVASGSTEHALVIGVERLSDLTDSYDRGSAFIFADGAGAAVIGPSDVPLIGPVAWGSDGSQADAIEQAESWDALRDNPEIRFPALSMKGQQVFRWAVYDMPKVAQRALDAAGVKASDLDVFVPHQANLRIIDAMVRQLDLPEDVVVAKDIIDTGNTSAASIPLAVSRLLESGQAKSGDLALFIGFGAGLAYAAQVVVLP